MSDFQNKNVKKPISFKKPGKNDKRVLPSQENLRPKKISLQTQIKKLDEEVKMLTSYSSDTIYRLDYRNMKYSYISPAVTRLLGFTPQEMKRINFRSLIVETRLVTDGIHKISSFEELEDKRKEGDVGKWNADYLIRTKSGDKIWVSDVSYPWFDDFGKVIGSVGSLRDITERVKIEQRLFSDIQSLSTHDALTNLPSKANFFAALDKELRRLKRSQSSLSLVLFDIDDLASINKEHGADIGDKLIIEISKILSAALRDTDYVSRIEGGMFAVQLPETEVKGAYYVADRVRDMINRREFSFGGDLKSLHCGISAGIATAEHVDNLSPADLFKLADTRLYIAKNTGQNQVSIDEIAQMH